MKLAIYILLISSIFTGQVQSQTIGNPKKYSGIQQAYKSDVFVDNFDSNANEWSTIDYGNQSAEIVEGRFHIKSTQRSKSLIREFPGLSEKDFEIEIIVELITDDYSHGAHRNTGLIWGKDERDRKQFAFSYNILSKVNIVEQKNLASVDFHVRNKNVYTKLRNTNKLTMRKVDGMLYFFINEKFIHKEKSDPFYGDGYGFAVSNAEMKIDYFRITEILNSEVLTPAMAPMAVVKPINPVPKDILVTLPIANVNVIEAQTALSTAVYISDVDVNIPLTSTIHPRRYALIIGNENYSANTNNLNGEANVKYAKKDAETFNKYAKNVLGIPSENIIFSIDAGVMEMNRSIHKLELLIKNTNGTGEFFVFYAGHGLPNEITKKGYLIPVDVSATDLNYAIELEDLYAGLSQYKSKSVTVFIDACFSGGARNNQLIETRGIRITPKIESLNGNIVVFTASKGNQSALENPKEGHGMFSYTLFEILKESHGDITYKDFYSQLSEKVAIQSILINSKEQNPSVIISPLLLNTWGDFKFK